MTEMVPLPICGRDDWTILMPAERATRVQWPWHEWNRFHSMFHNLKPGDVLFDIGAEQGDQSALYAKWVRNDFVGNRAPASNDMPGMISNSRGGVVLIEPNPVAWATIKAVWEANGLREPLGFCKGFITDQTNDEGAQSVLDAWPYSSRFPISKHVGTAEFRDGAPQTTIDALAKWWPSPDAITIDIEGAELDALMGAQQTLIDHRPLVWVSVHWQLLLERGQSRQDLIDYMHALGYRHEHLGEDHECHSFFYPEERTVVLPYDGVS